MNALDDLDRALAQMQGDDSGGTLPDALDAARRVRAADGYLERREQRIHAKVHKTGAMTSAAAFGVGALLADGPRGYVCLLAVVMCTIAADWPVPWRPVLASFRTHPRVWAITIVLGVGGGLAAGHAIGHPSPLWIAAAGVLLGLGALWVALILRAGSRNRKAT